MYLRFAPKGKSDIKALLVQDGITFDNDSDDFSDSESESFTDDLSYFDKLRLFVPNAREIDIISLELFLRAFRPVFYRCESVWSFPAVT